MISERIILFLIFLFFVVNPVDASTTGSVGSPIVTRDKTAVEMRLGYSEASETSSEDERLRTRVQIDHGVTSNIAARIILQGDDRKNDNHEFDSLTLESRLYLLEAAESGLDFGMRANYQFKDGDKKPSSLNFGFFELVSMEEYELRSNQLFSHEVGEDAGDGLEAELRLQFMRSYAQGNHHFGIEGFHDFGNLQEQNGYSAQSHTIGPVFKGKLPHNFKYETGYRAGISNAAANHNIKLFISRTF